VNSDPRDYKLDISSGAEKDAKAQGSTPASSGRPYLSVHFACCGVYLRIYRTADGTAYRGNCPKCAKAVNFPVGSGGTSARFFVVK
jgi:hypothetical protein